MHKHFLKHLDNSATKKPHPGVTQEGQRPLLAWRRALCGVKAPTSKSTVWANAGRAVVALFSDCLGPPPETPQLVSSWAALRCEPEHREGFTSKPALDLN